MRLKFLKRYDRWIPPKVEDVPDHLAPSLAGKFATVVTPTAEEVERQFRYRCLQLWAQAVGVPANQSREELKTAIIKTLKETDDE